MASGIILPALLRPNNLSDLTNVIAARLNLGGGTTGIDLFVAATAAIAKAALALVKGDVGLGNVDNTSDANKPVSTAQATADNLRVLKAGDSMTGALTISTANQNLLLTHATDPYWQVTNTTGSVQLFGQSLSTGARLGTLTNHNLDFLINATSVAVLTATDFSVLGSPVMTRGAAETVTGTKTFNGPTLFKNRLTLDGSGSPTAYTIVRNSSAMLFSGGPSGYIWNDTANGNVNMSLSDAGNLNVRTGIYGPTLISSVNGFGILKSDGFGYVVPGAGTNPAAYDPPTNGKMLFLASVPALYIGNGSSWQAI